MKKIFNSKFFYFVLGAIIFGSISSVIAYSLAARDVEYNPGDNSWKTYEGNDINDVQTAIDELRSGHYDFRKTSSYNKASQGNRSTSRSVSISLEKGNYIVLGTFATTAVYTGSTFTGTTRPNINISSCIELDAYSMVTNSSSNAPGTSVRHYLEERFGIWYCKFDDTTSVTITATSCCNETENASTVSVQAIKIK